MTESYSTSFHYSQWLVGMSTKEVEVFFNDDWKIVEEIDLKEIDILLGKGECFIHPSKEEKKWW